MILRLFWGVLFLIGVLVATELANDFMSDPMSGEIELKSQNKITPRPQNPLQSAIDAASDGDEIELSAGEFAGPIIIDKKISIIGDLSGQTHIKGSGNGDVIIIRSNGVVLKNLFISGSGNSHSELNSAIFCDQVSGVKIINNTITDSLFGVNFKQCNASEIIGNKISSKAVSLGLRGDAIRLWYSHDNKILDNEITHSRDMVIWYSSNNVIKNNSGSFGRYSLHFMYAGKNLVEQNRFFANSVGIFFMFSNGSLIKNNTVQNSTGAFGVGIGMKDTSDFVVENNILSYNARGLYLDQSPFQPESINVFKNNRILSNTVAVQMHATQHKTVFKNNDFIANMQVAINDTPGSKIDINEWQNNFYDDYEGFDRDANGDGDSEYRSFSYADQLWAYYPAMRFFYGSPVMGILNFLAKLAPFSEPELLIIDKNPKIRPNMSEDI